MIWYVRHCFPRWGFFVRPRPGLRQPVIIKRSPPRTSPESDPTQTATAGCWNLGDSLWYNCPIQHLFDIPSPRFVCSHCRSRRSTCPGSLVLRLELNVVSVKGFPGVKLRASRFAEPDHCAIACAIESYGGNLAPLI